MTTLPVIDVSDLSSGNPAGKSHVVAELGRACRETGFFYIVNHGIPQATRDAVFAAARTFFSFAARIQGGIFLQAVAP